MNARLCLSVECLSVCHRLPMSVTPAHTTYLSLYLPLSPRHAYLYRYRYLDLLMYGLDASALTLLHLPITPLTRRH